LLLVVTLGTLMNTIPDRVENHSGCVPATSGGRITSLLRKAVVVAAADAAMAECTQGPRTTGANMTSTDTDYAKLADPELFEERRRVREELAALPKCHAGRRRLSRVLDALTEEFDRRARSAWQRS
jgi:hypothetical protein